MGDISAKLKLYMEFHNWDLAFDLVKKESSLKESDIYLPYAKYLAMQDKFEEATQAFRKAGQPKEAIKLLEQLLNSAIDEKRYQKTAKYFWLLSYECLKLVSDDTKQITKQDNTIAKDNFWTYYQKAEAAYAFKFIDDFSFMPFITQAPEQIFRIAQFVYNCEPSGHVM
eukprot:UN28012